MGEIFGDVPTDRPALKEDNIVQILNRTKLQKCI